jgi:hypothetical protein
MSTQPTVAGTSVMAALAWPMSSARASPLPEEQARAMTGAATQSADARSDDRA